MSSGVIKVAIAGLGRSGWQIHARALERLTDQFRIVAVTDIDTERAGETALQLACRCYPGFDEMLGDPDAELIVVATPSHLHTEQTIQALQAGKHVVCEKPMALNTQAADRMIAAARKSGRVLSIFQNMRYRPDYLKVREIVDSGLLGKIVQIRLTMHRFSRRWDWQTLREFGGGDLNNGAAHLLDLAMEFLSDEPPQVWADVRHTLTCGDAEDHVRILLRTPSRPTLDIEISNSCAYPLDPWHIIGTHGGLRGSETDLHWKWTDFSQMPPRQAERRPSSNRSYNREQVYWHEDSWHSARSAIPTDFLGFYTDLYAALRAGARPAITPESIRRRIAVIDECRRLTQAPHDSQVDRVPRPHAEVYLTQPWSAPKGAVSVPRSAPKAVPQSLRP